MDVEILSHIQFALTISFHYIYPPLSTGLGLVMVLMEGMYVRTGNPLYEIMTKFYTRIFALIFGIGVATGIKTPGRLSFLVREDFKAPIKGLKSFKPEDRPNSPNTVFQTYHLMLSIGMFFIVLSIYAGVLLWRNRLFEKKWLMYIFLWGVLLSQLANQAGWFAAETGRQPWGVYGLPRTSDVLSKAVTANQVWFSLIMFTMVYMPLFSLFVF